MNDWNKLVLGEEDSQTAPVCNGTVREMIADIDRLKRYENIYRREFEAKQQLKAAEFEITELDGALSEVKRQLDASQALLAEAEYQIEKQTIETRAATQLASDYIKQLAEARADNERLKEQISDSIPMWHAKDLFIEARQEAAREIVEFLDVCCMSRSAEMIAERFGLEW